MSGFVSPALRRQVFVSLLRLPIDLPTRMPKLRGRFLMTLFQRQTPLGMLAFTLALALATVRCGSDTPTQPTNNPSVSAVTLSPSNTPAGTTAQGTVSLSAAAAAQGATVALSSSNATVATVQMSVTVPAAATSATFTISAMSPGTATITATLSGASRTATITVTGSTGGVALGSISLSPNSVVGGNPVTGTVMLTGAAPSGGAVVSLSGNDPVTVPATVTVPAGATTATFTVATKAVTQATSSTIGGSYGGASATAVLAVTAPVTVATARFGVRGSDVTDTCQMAPDGLSLQCTFDGSTSTAPGTIVAWDWTYTVPAVAATISKTTTTPILSMPSATCAFIPGPPLPAGITSFPLTVTLVIHDSLGNVSAVASETGARVLPQGACGFAAN
jgi:hypothetical protein